MPSSLATLVLFSALMFGLSFIIGEPSHHEACRMMQVSAEYAIYPVIDAVLNGSSAVLLLVGRSYIKRGRMAAHRAIMITALIHPPCF